MEASHEFYKEIIDQLLSTGVLHTQMHILAICGGQVDREVLNECGFRRVTIANLDSRMTPGQFAPFEWSFQDAENLTFQDNAFDFSIVSLGLHHCSSPHRALLEIYRVARNGLVLLEPCDNVLTRLGVRLKIGQDYEHAAVFYSDYSFGGVKNSKIPNFVYRWTEREIRKTINSFAPYGTHTFQFIYKMTIPWTQLTGRRVKLFYYAVRCFLPVLRVFSLFFPKQGNNFAAVILKPVLPRDLHPWLAWKQDEIHLNHTWLSKRYAR
jgi:SAM-dependent methyltransferase